MPNEEKKTLEESLIEKGVITDKQLKEASKIQEKSGEFLGKILIEMKAISSPALVDHLSSQFKIPKVDLSRFIIDADTVKLIPESVCREHKIIPLFKIDNTLTVAMANPLDILAIDKINSETGCIVEVVVSTETDIINAIDQYYKISDTITKVVDDLGVGLELEPGKVKLEGIEAIEEVPVVKAVNLIIIQAIKDMASDIHIEPDQNILRVRYRVDGVLHEALQLPARLQSVVVSRIKVLAGMNITEKRLPQDGHIEFNLEGKGIDLRVASYPVVLGEKVVLRILHKTGIMYGLEELGFLPETLNRFDALIRQPHGIILATGPTGTGKTTTLYAALQKINTLERNIITIEDPVEYQLNILNQSQINPKAGWTFATGLRSILRQDPDVIMVGEIRDLDTASISIQSALTGHLVFSTLHTNDASSTATRLIDMGVEPFLVSASLIGALAQRLVRLICPKCKEVYKPKKELVESLKLDKKNPTFYKGKGCKYCSQTGYKGRVGIFELMIPNDEVRSLIVAKATPDLISKAAKKAGMLTLREAGLPLVLEGKTTLQELIRVTQDEVMGG